MSGSGDYGALRSDVLVKAHLSAQQRANEGFSAAEIEARLDGDLTVTERELLRPLIRSEVAHANRAHLTDSPGRKHGWAPRPSRHW